MEEGSERILLSAAGLVSDWQLWPSIRNVCPNIARCADGPLPDARGGLRDKCRGYRRTKRAGPRPFHSSLALAILWGEERMGLHASWAAHPRVVAAPPHVIALARAFLRRNDGARCAESVPC
jgi:hypothetical protein